MQSTSVPLYIDVIGQGQPLVLLHGWGLHGGIWQALREPLAQHFTLHIIDLPGMGWSSEPMPETLTQLAQLLRPHIPDGAHIMGWSLGGLLAMQIAQQQTIGRLVLLGTTPCFVHRGDWQHGVQQQVFTGFFEQVMQDVVAGMQTFAALIAMGGRHTRQELKQLLAILLERPYPRLQALQAGLGLLMQSDLRQQLSQIQSPVLWIHGERDKLCPVAAAHWSVKQMPHAELQTIADAGHEPFISHPALVLDAVLRFLTP